MKLDGASVAIVGGGLIGCSIAYNLAKAGIDVCVLEKRTVGAEASGRCAGGVRQQARDPAELPVAMYSVGIWATLDEELGYDTEYRRTGNLQLVTTEEELSQLRARVQRENAMGLHSRVMSADEVLGMVPPLRASKLSIIGGGYCPTDGSANPFRTTKAFAVAARRHGARIHTHTRVLSMRRKGSRIESIVTDRGEVTADLVINAAGPWGAEIGRMLGITIPIKPRRDQMAITESIDPVVAPFLSMPGNFGYYVQTCHGNLLLAHVIRPGEPYDRRVTLFGITFQARRTLELFPELKYVSVIRSYGGINDQTPDRLPIIGEAQGIDNFLIVAGFSGHGFCLGPAIGRLICQRILGSTLDVSLDAFRYDRFARDYGWTGAGLCDMP